ncbi:hypothetical protein ACFVJK_46870 [Streptomyces sp. NPDC127172]|uniref:hypothetical protein n=1 Tax=Streptomyces sp. NPDC127172 TaxID=3345382 RepID=UPI0036286012
MTDTTPKPPVPAAKFQDWPRIPVDTAEGSVHYQLTTIGRRVAQEWIMGPDGPYTHPEQTMTATVRGLVGVTLLHLMELGLVDVDAARMAAADGIPWSLNDFRPDTAPPQHLENGANAEDCPACKGTNPPYPFICPGPDGNPDTEARSV